MKVVKSLCLSIIILFLTNVVVYAAEENQLDVAIDVMPSFTVTVPQSISACIDRDTEYSIKVTGDIGAADTVVVEPTSTSFIIYNSDDHSMTKEVTLQYEEANTQWNYTEVASACSKSGLIKMPVNLTAGVWEGSILFDVSYKTEDAVPTEVLRNFSVKNALCSFCRTGEQYNLNITGSGKLETPELVEGKNWCAAELSGYENVDVYISEGVTKLGNQYFLDCDVLKVVQLPSTVTELGCQAFRGSTVESIDISHVTVLDEQCFAFASKLKDIRINNNLEKIPYMAFYGANCLETVNLPTSLKIIGQEAFKWSGIKSLELPEGLTTIEGGAFYGCDNLSEIHIPSSVTLIQGSVNVEGIDYKTFQGVGKVVLHNMEIEIPEDKWGALEVVYDQSE